MSKEQSEQLQLLYEVYFSVDNTVAVDTPNPYILISPEKGVWDDFGHKCGCTYVIRDGLKIIHKDSLKIGFLGNTKSAVATIKEFVSEGYLSATNFPQFFSLYGTLSDYREIVVCFGSEKAKKILLSLNDLVALRYYKGTPSWVDKAVKSEVFALSFVRNSECFFAFHNADSVLRGVDEEAFDRISNQMVLRFQLNGFSNWHELEFSFDSKSILPKRINVLIGKNGLGKSQVLSRIVKSFLCNNSDLRDHNNERPMVSRLLALGTPGETTNTFPKEKQQPYINYVSVN